MNISIKDFISKSSKERLNIIDIRDEYSYSLNHIPNSINVNKISLLQQPNKYLDKIKTYYIYCSAGHNSGIVTTRLNNLGYKVINISGGYNSYIKEGKI